MSGPNGESHDEMRELFGIEVAPKRRVYVGARSGLVQEARACAKLLRGAGIEVCSEWHDDPRFHNDFNGATAEYCESEAQRDVQGLQRATHMVRLSDGTVGTGGNCVEWGIALQLGLIRILVGAPANVFDRAASVIRAEAGDDLITKVLA